MSSILITGGAGTLGSTIIELILSGEYKSLSDIDHIKIFSRNETQQYKLKQKFNENIDSIIGDIRDYEAVHRAMKDVKYVIHAAAIKHIDVAEQNPSEAFKTNVIGTDNVIKSALLNGVEILANISTDKTCNPNSTYGATKLIGEKITSSAAVSFDKTYFNCRFGNILGSNGSVFHLWKKLYKENKQLTITHNEMTRFFIKQNDAARFVLDQIIDPLVGYTHVPLLNSYSISDIATYISKKNDHLSIGLRPGEKIHEDLVNESEMPHAVITNDLISINPNNKIENNIDFINLSSKPYTNIKGNDSRFLGKYAITPDYFREFLDNL
jgi:FlaA1/EpsC-like NDP-sugar epimerase